MKEQVEEKRREALLRKQQEETKRLEDLKRREDEWKKKAEAPAVRAANPLDKTKDVLEKAKAAEADKLKLVAKDMVRCFLFCHLMHHLMPFTCRDQTSRRSTRNPTALRQRSRQFRPQSLRAVRRRRPQLRVPRGLDRPMMQPKKLANIQRRMALPRSKPRSSSASSRLHLPAPRPFLLSRLSAPLLLVLSLPIPRQLPNLPRLLPSLPAPQPSLSPIPFSALASWHQRRASLRRSQSPNSTEARSRTFLPSRFCLNGIFGLGRNLFLSFNSESDDDEDRRENQAPVPGWAQTPNLNFSLATQSNLNPEKVFGKVQPLALEGELRRRFD